MKQIIVQRLFQSFVELERAIKFAKMTLKKKQNVPAHLLKRIDEYETILEKQRTLATALCGHACLGNWDEVARHVRIINGLSGMIRDDAREVIAGAETETIVEAETVMIC